MLGFKADDKDPDRTAHTFQAFRQRHVALQDVIAAPAFTAVCRFLSAWDPRHADDHAVLADVPTGFGVFQILGETSFVHEDPVVRSWWEQNLKDPDEGPAGQCLISGAVLPTARLHPKIRGIAGGKAEASLVSFKEPAYESYGKTQSHNSPVSDMAAFRYAAALNALLDGPMHAKHRITVSDATVVFWTGRPSLTEDIFARFATEGSASLEQDEIQDESVRQKLEAFLNALRTGRSAYDGLERDPDHTPFFLLGLAPNAARVSIRFFMQNTLSELLDNLRHHYRDISIAPEPARGRRKADPEFPPAWMLLAQSARESKGIPPILAGPLLRAIVTGIHYPDALYSAVLRRIHADRIINYPRACVIKGTLSRNRGMEVTMSLDSNRPEPPYRLGRLFAALEKTQLDALGSNLNATIRDRFYSSASATPVSVFPRLLRTYQHHLGKLGGGRRVNREKLVQEILAPLVSFPAHLSLADQGLFALGYYHQIRDFYTAKAGEAVATD